MCSFATVKRKQMENSVKINTGKNDPLNSSFKDEKKKRNILLHLILNGKQLKIKSR